MGEIVRIIVGAGEVRKRFHTGGVMRQVPLEIADRFLMLSTDRIGSAAKQIGRMERGVMAYGIAQLADCAGVVLLREVDQPQVQLSGGPVGPEAEHFTVK